MIDRKKFDRCKRFLRRKYKIDAPIRIIFVSQSLLRAEWEVPMYGDFYEKITKKGKPRYVIRISDNLSTRDAIQTLIHEFSHVIQVHKGLPQLADHDRVFKAIEAALIKEYSESPQD